MPAKKAKALAAEYKNYLYDPKGEFIDVGDGYKSLDSATVDADAFLTEAARGSTVDVFKLVARVKQNTGSNVTLVK